MADQWTPFDSAAEKRIRRIVYCGEQLMTKRLHLWSTRYKRAASEAKTVAELDEALMRLHEKFPQLGLDGVVAGVQSDG